MNTDNNTITIHMADGRKMEFLHSEITGVTRSEEVAGWLFLRVAIPFSGMAEPAVTIREFNVGER